MSRFAAMTLVAVTVAAAAQAPAQERAPAGAFDYYLLALSWSPTYCTNHREPAARAECDLRRGLIVHGLWPQDEDGRWPEFCRPVATVPAPIVERERQSMPNADMVEHEWDKHGSCTRLTVENYFDQLDRAFAELRIPEALTHPDRSVALPLDRAKTLFVDANPGLAAGMVALRCRPGGMVEEIRVCLDENLRFRSCGAGQADACPDTIRFPAVPAPDAQQR